MSEIKQKIITVDAKAFFKYFPKEIAEDQKCFTLKYANRALYKLVVQQENEMEVKCIEEAQIIREYDFEKIRMLMEDAK